MYSVTDNIYLICEMKLLKNIMVTIIFVLLGKENLDSNKWNPLTVMDGKTRLLLSMKIEWIIYEIKLAKVKIKIKFLMNWINWWHSENRFVFCVNGPHELPVIVCKLMYTIASLISQFVAY